MPISRDRPARHPREETGQPQKTFLVFGATGQTGKHFTSLAQRDGHRVRALVRSPGRLAVDSRNLEVRQGSITDVPDLDGLIDGVDAVVSLLGDAQIQKKRQINTAFVRQLVPAMRRHGVTRFLYQAGALSAPPGQKLPPLLWAIRNTVARGYIGQHEDNEAVMQYFAGDAMDIGWMVHRAAIGSDGPSKGALERSSGKTSVATFRDCASYNYRLLSDPAAVHTCDLSSYRKRLGKALGARTRSGRRRPGIVCCSASRSCCLELRDRKIEDLEFSERP